MMQLTRRQFLGVTTAAGAIALAGIEPALPSKLKQPAFPQIDTSRTLVRSDMREIAQYLINYDAFNLRYDIRFALNGRGKERQYCVDCMFPYGRNAAAEVEILRSQALAALQKAFDKHGRIRANLLPLRMPRGVQTVEELLRAA